MIHYYYSLPGNTPSLMTLLTLKCFHWVCCNQGTVLQPEFIDLIQSNSLSLTMFWCQNIQNDKNSINYISAHCVFAIKWIWRFFGMRCLLPRAANFSTAQFMLHVHTTDEADSSHLEMFETYWELSWCWDWSFGPHLFEVLHIVAWSKIRFTLRPNGYL